MKLKKTYKVIAMFKWGNRWLAVNEDVALRDCEATALIHTQKIELIKSQPKKGK